MRSSGGITTEIHVTIIDEYTGNILGQTTLRQFAQSYHGNVRENIVGLQFTLENVLYKVTRQSTEISAYPAYEVYVRPV